MNKIWKPDDNELRLVAVLNINLDLVIERCWFCLR